jgi:hypothetical protein
VRGWLWKAGGKLTTYHQVTEFKIAFPTSENGAGLFSFDSGTDVR